MKPEPSPARAEQRIGRFELAHHGTLFLDEIAEIPAEVTGHAAPCPSRADDRAPIGGNESVPVEVPRFIAATNRDLLDAIVAGEFSRGSLLPLERLPDPRAAIAGTARRPVVSRSSTS